jgi:hypothetical protein
MSPSPKKNDLGPLIRQQMPRDRVPTDPARLGGPLVRTTTPCDCRALEAFHAWRNETLKPSSNTMIDFANWGLPGAGRRAVIELVTAWVQVPKGESARLRMYTSLGRTASNLDLVLVPQGGVAGQSVFIASHSLRAYTDNLIEFCVNRDNATTSGSALICVSGYLVDAP